MRLNKKKSQFIEADNNYGARIVCLVDHQSTTLPQPLKISNSLYPPSFQSIQPGPGSSHISSSSSGWGRGFSSSCPTFPHTYENQYARIQLSKPNKPAVVRHNYSWSIFYQGLAKLILQSDFLKSCTPLLDNRLLDPYTG